MVGNRAVRSAAWGDRPVLISGHHKLTMSSEAGCFNALDFLICKWEVITHPIIDLSLVTNSGIVSMEPSAVPHMEHMLCKLQLMLLWVFSF